MSKLYNKKPQALEKQHRNNFDLSFQTNGTFRLGRLYPVLNQFCLANQSLRINPAVGLRSLAMNFPTQTRLKASLSFFKVPIRYIWDSFPEWLSMSNDARAQYGTPKKDIEVPWVSPTDAMLKSGGLLDWLGVPTTFASTDYIPQVLSTAAYFGDKLRNADPRFSGLLRDPNIGADLATTPLALTSRATNVSPYRKINADGKSDGLVNNSSPHAFRLSYGYAMKQSLAGSIHRGTGSTVTFKTIGLSDGVHTLDILVYHDGVCDMVTWSDNSSTGLRHHEVSVTISNNVATLQIPENTINSFTPVVIEVNKWIHEGKNVRLFIGSTEFSDPSVPANDDSFKSIEEIKFSQIDTPSINDAVDMGVKPFSGNNPTLKLNAFSLRAYKAIVNSHFRNTEVDPYMVNGVLEFEKFCNTADGKDNDSYDFYNKNWEADQFTTMHPSAQLGDAPLVGLSYGQNSELKDLTVTLKQTMPPAKYSYSAGQLDGVSEQKEYSFQPIWDDDDPDKIIGFTSSERDVPSDLLDLIRHVQVGWSAQDMRNGLALQRYLEARIRSNYRYKTLMRDIYHTEVSSDTLKMPEYLGGVNYDINVNTIVNQTAGDTNAMLGDFGANCTLLSDKGGTISVFCNEHSIVMGIFSITPVPTYSQLLKPQMLVPASPLEWYIESFANLPKMPVYAKYITPLQRAAEEGEKMDEVIGYQRPWWQYLQNNDEIHGEMRTDYAGFVITRIFDQTPKLNKDFIQCTADSVVTPFPDKTLDTFLGMIYFDIDSKMPLPKYDTIHI